MFGKWGFLTKTVNFLKNGWSDQSEKLHAVRHDGFEKLKFEQRAPLETPFFEERKNNFRYSSQYNVKQ